MGESVVAHAAQSAAYSNDYGDQTSGGGGHRDGCHNSCRQPGVAEENSAQTFQARDDQRVGAVPMPSGLDEDQRNGGNRAAEHRYDSGGPCGYRQARSLAVGGDVNQKLRSDRQYRRDVQQQSRRDGHRRPDLRARRRSAARKSADSSGSICATK